MFPYLETENKGCVYINLVNIVNCTELLFVQFVHGSSGEHRLSSVMSHEIV